MGIVTIKSADGTQTAYSQAFDEHYHSTKEGALTETLQKHVIPAFELKKSQKELHILDICFGLGFNTLSTIAYYKKHAPQTKIYIYTPELDAQLIGELEHFCYPPELAALKSVIDSLADNCHYKDQQYEVELFLGDARKYIKRFSNRFDIVYQDAFSPKKNPSLWTKEYFADIKKSMKSDAILTTYSTALSVRLALHENAFFLYLKEHAALRNSTIASLSPLMGLKAVAMEHKIACNPNAKALSDKETAQ